MSQIAPLANALHRVLCNETGTSPVPTSDHPWHYDTAKELVEDMRRWGVYVVHINPDDEFPTLTVGSDGQIAA